ncbi:MAG: hypothetical protein QM765_01140 [Myxococcales bacterium]
MQQPQLEALLLQLAEDVEDGDELAVGALDVHVLDVGGGDPHRLACLLQPLADNAGVELPADEQLGLDGAGGHQPASL